jgi:uridylate kinase
VRVVLRIGGSVIASPPNAQLMRKYSELIETMAQAHQLVVVVGGGSLAREIIEIAREVGLSEPEQDEMAISVSRLFAQLLAMTLHTVASKSVPSSIDAAVELLRRSRVVVMGGVKPGMTTDAVAAMVAEKTGADLLVKASDVDGVYTKDPKKHPDAQKIDRLGFNDLQRVFELNEHRAGIHQILDPEAIKVVQRSKIKMVVVNGSSPENVLSALKGENIGTIIE